MIKTDWKKCDNKECGLVAWLRLKDPEYNLQLQVCMRHYEEVKNTRNWEVENL